MPTFLPKLILTPLLIGGASLAQRRWGAQIGGWIVALPLTSGPIILFVAFDQSASLAAILVLRGLLYGLPGFATFCLLVGALLDSTGIAVAFALSLGAALAVQGSTLLVLMTRRPRDRSAD